MARIGIDARLIRQFGMGSYVRGLLHGLAAVGGGEQYVVFGAEEDRPMVPPQFEYVPTAVPTYSVRELVEMARVASRARLDLLHVPHFVVPLTRLPVVTTLFDAIPFHFAMPNRRGTPYVAWMMQWAASRADRVLTISGAARADLLEAFDCPSDKIVVTHLGVDERFFNATRTAPSQRYFLFSGRVASHKNLPALLQAFEIVRRRDPELRLVLAGSRHEPYRGLPGVIVAGFLPDDELVSAFAGALALVMPSFMEGFGLPPLEAMAAGAPVITSTARALVEVTGDAALHVDPRSPGALAEAMWRVATDEGLRRELALRGRERARAFTWERCAEQTLAVYRDVLGVRRSRA